MNLINWRDEWHLLLDTIKRQDFEHVLEKSNRHDLLVTIKGVAVASIASGMGALVGGLIYGPVGVLAGSTTANAINYAVNIKYKSIYELIKQLSSEESYQLLANIKAVLGGVFNEQTIILGAVVVAKEIYQYISELTKSVNNSNNLSSSNNFIIIEDIDN